jgi:hypothetical protein
MEAATCSIEFARRNVQGFNMSSVPLAKKMICLACNFQDDGEGTETKSRKAVLSEKMTAVQGICC